MPAASLDVSDSCWLLAKPRCWGHCCWLMLLEEPHHPESCSRGGNAWPSMLSLSALLSRMVSHARACSPDKRKSVMKAWSAKAGDQVSTSHDARAAAEQARHAHTHLATEQGLGSYIPAARAWPRWARSTRVPCSRAEPLRAGTPCRTSLGALLILESPWGAMSSWQRRCGWC